MGFDMTREEAATLYRRERGVACYSLSCTPETFDTACAAEVLRGEKHNDALARHLAWIAALDTVRIDCPRCHGTGVYARSWVHELGCGMRPQGETGTCYRCEGKGFQVRADWHRNAKRDEHAIAEAFRAMMGV